MKLTISLFTSLLILSCNPIGEIEPDKMNSSEMEIDFPPPF